MSWRLALIPLMAMVAAGLALALLLGARAASTSETEVIEQVAARYVAEAGSGARLADCQAVPAQSPGLWLVVICLPQDGGGMEYFIDRFGRIADSRMRPDRT